jgi:Fic family protein
MTRKRANRRTGPLIADAAERARLEARNALLQFDEVRKLIRQRGGELRLTPEDICALQGIAVRDVFAGARKYRRTPIVITNTQHEPPAWKDVPRLVSEMCDHANSISSDALSTAAYLMWRLNWIHPFADGNGRTSRAISYLGLCCGYGFELPGTVTVPDLIVKNRIPYYHALDAADSAWRTGKVDTDKMQKLIADLLERQLESAV